jgi:hypothetical protein
VIKVTAVPGLVKFVVGGGVENTSSPKAATPLLRKVGAWGSVCAGPTGTPSGADLQESPE